MQIVFNQVFDERGFSGCSLEPTAGALRGERGTPAYLHDHPGMQSATIQSLLRSVGLGGPVASPEKVLVENSRPLVLLLNQLMAHQNLLKFEYLQTICQFGTFFHKTQTHVLTVLRRFVDEFKINIENNNERLRSDESQNEFEIASQSKSQVEDQHTAFHKVALIKGSQDLSQGAPNAGGLMGAEDHGAPAQTTRKAAILASI